MSRRASPTLIGAFVLGATVLAVTVVLLLAGGSIFQERRRHIIYFEGAAQGLQVGAPVMFLGVKVGSVTKIQLGLDERNARFTVPVSIEIEPNAVRSQSGETIDLRDRATLRRQVDRGLRAQLRMQSLLTGQLYVDLDFHPDKPAVFVALDPDESEIPAIPTSTQELAAKLANFPGDKFLNDVAEIGQSLRTLLADPTLSELPRRMAAVLAHMEALTATLDQEAKPTLGLVRDDLGELRRTLIAARTAVKGLETAAGQLGGLSSPIGTALVSLGQAGEELGRTAQTLRQVTDEDSPQVVHLNAALDEMTRAARALRLLAETLEQQPEALLRGKAGQDAQ